MFGVLSAWLVEIAIITYRDVAKSNGQNQIYSLPLPADYISTFVVYGALGAVSEVQSASTFAGLTAWGFTIATLLRLYTPPGTTDAAQQKLSVQVPNQTVQGAA